MKAPIGLLFFSAVAVILPGCLVPKAELNASLTENRAHRTEPAQLAEIENLKAHSRALEDRVIHSEKQLAVAQERAGLDGRRLEGYEREREGLYQQFKDLSYAGGRLPPELSRQLADLSRRFPSLQFDPETGISKLDTDILFDSGEAELKPGRANCSTNWFAS